ncbi:unnamed protein product [Tuber aestivum]|uniref:Uncharacterized protein n=1 Tax=Tuber aestivum TaxID=59557 RepID=A0A292Q636_9PEZI|nr:unnamed protein product [Tuber aestivum]
MAVNDPAHPELARAAQDVEGEPGRPSSSDSFHGGRGVRYLPPPSLRYLKALKLTVPRCTGAGNAVHTADSDLMKLRQSEESQRLTPDANIDYRGWADKGKDFLFRNKKKKGGK